MSIKLKKHNRSGKPPFTGGSIVNDRETVADFVECRLGELSTRHGLVLWTGACMDTMNWRIKVSRLVDSGTGLDMWTRELLIDETLAPLDRHLDTGILKTVEQSLDNIAARLEMILE